MTKALAAALSFLLSASLDAATLPPRDECGGDRGLAAVRAKLAAAVARRDGRALLALIAPDIRWSFGGDGGKASFAREWRLGTAAARSPVWGELSKILPLGCARQGGGASVPYLFARIPAARDPFSTAVTTRPVVNLRAAPRTGAPVLARLRWEIVTSQDLGYGGGWAKVKTDGGMSGYVNRDYLQSPVGYRILFNKIGDRWLITAFIAGD